MCGVLSVPGSANSFGKTECIAKVCVFVYALFDDDAVCGSLQQSICLAVLMLERNVRMASGSILG